jgi:hypothetical protein
MTAAPWACCILIAPVNIPFPQVLEHPQTAGAASDIVMRAPEPIFTADVHYDYVDHVAWVGDMLLSKSVHDEIVLWKPLGNIRTAAELGMLAVPMSGIHVLHRFKVPKAHLWFVRFGLCVEEGLLACGNTEGKVFVWPFDVAEGARRGALAGPPAVVSCNASAAVPIRRVAIVNRDAVLAGTDDGRVVLLQREVGVGSGAKVAKGVSVARNERDSPAGDLE